MHRAGSRPAAAPAAALALVPAALAFLAHLPALDHPFVYDDVVTVLRNPALDPPLRLGTLLLQDRFRPLTSLSFGLDAARAGRDATAYHLTSLLLHVAVTVLLFALARALARRSGSPHPDRVALATAALFAVHPLATQAVGYVSARAELLAAGFFLAALLALLGGARPVLGSLLFALALLSKETAAMLPAVLFAAHRLATRPDPGRATRVRQLDRALLAAAAILAAGRVVAYALFESEMPARSAWQNLLMEFGVVWRYLALLVAPHRQSLVHEVAPVLRPTDAGAALAGAGLFALALAATRLAPRAPLAALGVLWFLLVLVPSSSLLPLAEPMAEHRAYLASAGIFLAAGESLARLPRRPAAFLLAALVVSCLALTRARHAVWSDPVRLWGEAARRAPRVWLAHYGHGDALREAGRCAEAIAAYRRAIALLPGEPRAWLKLRDCEARLR